MNTKLTPQQEAIIRSTGDIRINAVAGSGKTTTLVEYAAARPSGSRILYIAFNKSVKQEAIRKFTERGLSNVQVETAHSLAFRHVVPGSNFRVSPTGYKTHEIAALLQFPAIGEKHGEYIIANHINKFISYFCNSDKTKVQELNYLDTITDELAGKFVRSFYQVIEDGTRQLLARMNRGEIAITHDFYLKRFQLMNPQLPYDYILFDEAQDASATMLAIFNSQKATKVMVGDKHQQIYGWRFAENGLDKSPFSLFELSTSFRFPQPIADLGSDVLGWKTILGKHTPVTITGAGKGTAKKTKATIARTNLGLLLNAINFITDNPKARKIYFEGNISSYTYADDGTSLYDVLNLYNEKPDMIRDQMIKTMKDVDELEEYIEKTEDVQLSIMLDIVKEYENEIYDILKDLKGRHIDEKERANADMVFSTVHRAKGMEYDVVLLVNDFMTEAKLEKTKEENEQPDFKKLNEEVNLLYVAITRAKTKLLIPETLLPKNFPPATCIEPVAVKKEITYEREQPVSGAYQRPSGTNAGKGKTPGKSGSWVKPAGPGRSVPAKTLPGRSTQDTKDAYQPWTTDLDKELRRLYQLDQPVSQIARDMNRTRGAIMARLKKFNFFLD
ncbi:MAG: ATP-dependent helicase [Chitinophagaceae bacterium]|nr:MAG: ATP-dependent helicase [Chitinophagaceae bacterium]